MTQTRLEEIKARRGRYGTQHLGSDVVCEAFDLAESDVRFLLELIESLEAGNRWIPINERLPENDITVLVYMPNGIDAFGVSFISHGRWQEIGLGHEDVTHWMPLPQPPADKGV